MTDVNLVGLCHRFKKLLKLLKITALFITLLKVSVKNVSRSFKL